MAAKVTPLKSRAAVTTDWLVLRLTALRDTVDIQQVYFLPYDGIYVNP